MKILRTGILNDFLRRRAGRERPEERGDLSSGRRNSPGFTFIELAVVLLIIGIVLVLAFPTLHRLGSNDLSLSARHLVRTVFFMAHQAAATKQVYRLNFDLDRNEYWATVGSPEGNFQPAEATLFKRTVLRAPVRFKDAVTAQDGKVSIGEVHTDFSPVGRVDKTILHLIGERDAEMTIVILPMLGKTRVYDGYFEEENAGSF